MAGIKTAAIEPEALDVLKRARIDGGVLFLPEEKLPRPLYLAVNTALVALGGKWDRRAKGHVFADPTDLHAALGGVLDSGEVVLPNKNGYFPTPEKLARCLVAIADIQPSYHVLEPSAGQGAIADILAEIVGVNQVFCVELLPQNAKVLRDKGYATTEGDFLTVDIVGAYDAIVMNPPFEQQQDIAHVLHAWKLLRPGGTLVSVMSAGVLFREDRRAKEFREFVDKHDGCIEKNPPESFRASGTDVSTATVVLVKDEL